MRRETDCSSTQRADVGGELVHNRSPLLLELGRTAIAALESQAEAQIEALKHIRGAAISELMRGFEPDVELLACGVLIEVGQLERLIGPGRAEGELRGQDHLIGEGGKREEHQADALGSGAIALAALIDLAQELIEALVDRTHIRGLVLGLAAQPEHIGKETGAEIRDRALLLVGRRSCDRDRPRLSRARLRRVRHG